MPCRYKKQGIKGDKGEKSMELWLAAVIMVIALARGAGLIIAGRKTKKKFLIFCGIAPFVIAAGCILYLSAALLLLGGID
jgi:CHASE2 domain-containing sensor protein